MIGRGLMTSALAGMDQHRQITRTNVTIRARMVPPLETVAFEGYLNLTLDAYSSRY